MKFSLFAHMERSDETRTHRDLFLDLEDLVLAAEAAGFETAWIGEHHGMEFTIAPNPFVQLAHLAARTSTIRLGTGNVVAPFWHPIKLAGEAAMTDVASNGRLDLGVARGAYSFEYERLVPGLDAWHRQRQLGRLGEALPCVARRSARTVLVAHAQPRPAGEHRMLGDDTPAIPHRPRVALVHDLDRIADQPERHRVTVALRQDQRKTMQDLAATVISVDLVEANIHAATRLPR